MGWERLLLWLRTACLREMDVQVVHLGLGSENLGRQKRKDTQLQKP